ncbi:hypothetical protein [Nocardia amamiensis]|uniref:hypothetical protein n=1 Tax=Nocardia amamiensis TaxID=404578 RepID=UPI00082EFB17|nr:hypothetical protein [Nocardia amamiensis]
MSTTGSELPELPRRVVRVEFGKGSRHPAISYTAPADVIARFVVALKNWNPDYTVEVESADDPEGNVPPLPYWQLWAWD